MMGHPGWWGVNCAASIAPRVGVFGAMCHQSDRMDFYVVRINMLYAAREQTTHGQSHVGGDWGHDVNELGDQHT